MLRVAILFAFLVVSSSGTSALADAPIDDSNGPAVWALAQFQSGETADFNDRCGDTTDWNSPCRRLPAQFLVGILKDLKLLDQIGERRVRIRGARIDGTLALSNTEISAEVWIEESRIDGDLFLDGSHLDRIFSLRGSELKGRY